MQWSLCGLRSSNFCTPVLFFCISHQAKGPERFLSVNVFFRRLIDMYSSRNKEKVITFNLVMALLRKKPAGYSESQNSLHK